MSSIVCIYRGHTFYLAMCVHEHYLYKCQRCGYWYMVLMTKRQIVLAELANESQKLGLY